MSEHIDNLVNELGKDVEDTQTDENTEEQAETTEETVEEGKETEEKETEKKEETPEYDETDIPEKFHGKTRQEIVESYINLEKNRNERPLGEKERKVLKDEGVDRKDLREMDDIAKELEKAGFGDEQANKYAEIIIKTAEKRSEAKVREIIQRQQELTKAVNDEIDEATKLFPLLKTSPEFRRATSALLATSAQTDKPLTLKEAGQKVMDLVEMKKVAKETEKKKVEKEKEVERTAVEKPSGSEATKKEEEDPIDRAFNTGTPGGLKGLGI